MKPTKPQSGPGAKDPNSANQQRLARRTLENLSPAMRRRRDDYVDGLLMGLSKYRAAIYAGVPTRSAHKEGSNLWCEPYVQDRFRELREKIDEDQLLTRKELILNVKSIAFDDGEQGGPRVSASALLAKIMGYEAAQVIEANIKGTSGIDFSKLSTAALREIMKAYHDQQAADSE